MPTILYIESRLLCFHLIKSYQYSLPPQSYVSSSEILPVEALHSALYSVCSVKLPVIEAGHGTRMIQLFQTLAGNAGRCCNFRSI